MPGTNLVVRDSTAQLCNLRLKLFSEAEKAGDNGPSTVRHFTKVGKAVSNKHSATYFNELTLKNKTKLEFGACPVTNFVHDAAGNSTGCKGGTTGFAVLSTDWQTAQDHFFYLPSLSRPPVLIAKPVLCPRDFWVRLMRRLHEMVLQGWRNHELVTPKK